MFCFFFYKPKNTLCIVRFLKEQIGTKYLLWARKDVFEVPIQQKCCGTDHRCRSRISATRPFLCSRAEDGEPRSVGLLTRAIKRVAALLMFSAFPELLPVTGFHHETSSAHTAAVPLGIHAPLSCSAFKAIHPECHG